MKNILYLVDNEIQYYSFKTKKLYRKTIPKDIIFLGKIAKPKSFYKYMHEFLKTNKLLTYIFKENISIIINDYFKDADKIIIKELFEKLYYKKIHFINDKTLLNITSNKIIINNNESYTLAYFKDKYNKTKVYLLENRLFSNECIYRYIADIDKTKTKYIFGNKKNAEYNSEYDYFYQEKETYLISQLYNVKR